MSKRADTSGIDPSMVIRQAKKSNREPLPEERPPVAEVRSEAPEPEAVREEPRRRRQKAEPQDYAALFLREASITARSGKTVYVCKEHHDRINKILHVIGKNEVSLFSYIYNVLEHHFSTFQEDITELYDNNIEKPF